jgi:predicted chitinase
MPLKEQAMFMANAVWETGALQYMEEMACKNGACPYGKYYGRGIIQLTHDYNYQEASSDVYRDNRLITNPDLVSEPEGAFRTALWFWTKRVRPALKLADIEENNLGPSIKIINALECPAGDKAKERLAIYNDILDKWGIASGNPGRLEGC